MNQLIGLVFDVPGLRRTWPSPSAENRSALHSGVRGRMALPSDGSLSANSTTSRAWPSFLPRMMRASLPERISSRETCTHQQIGNIVVVP